MISRRCVRGGENRAQIREIPRANFDENYGTDETIRIVACSQRDRNRLIRPATAVAQVSPTRCITVLASRDCRYRGMSERCRFWPRDNSRKRAANADNASNNSQSTSGGPLAVLTAEADARFVPYEEQIAAAPCSMVVLNEFRPSGFRITHRDKWINRDIDDASISRAQRVSNDARLQLPPLNQLRDEIRRSRREFRRVDLL